MRDPLPRRPSARVAPALAGVLVLLALGPLVAARPGDEAAEAAPRSLVLFIADGLGPASLTLARQAAEDRGDDLPALRDGVVGSVATRSASSHVTDSAASATALATGVATDNRVVGLDPAGDRLVNVLEKARAAGMRTGVVTNTSVTHATPAAFTAHVASRDDEPDIAAQQVVADVDVLLGGGARFFVPASEDEPHGRADGRDLLAEAREAGKHVVTTAAELEALAARPPDGPVLGVFASEHLAYVLDDPPPGQPTLAAMTAFAVERLSAGGAPFVLVVEGGRIDHAAHDNDAATHLREIEDHFANVAGLVRRARTGGEDWLVLGVSDHETGGLSLGRNRGLLGVQDWDPALLDRQTASVERMVARARAGEDLLAVYRETGGVGDLSEEEALAVEHAAAWLPGLAVEATEDVASHGLSRALTAPLARRAGLDWGTWWHTAVDVPLFAWWGPGREQLAGHHTHEELGVLLQDLLGLTDD